MAVMQTVRPWLHPKTSVWCFRRKVPQRLQGVAGKELVQWTLGTKDRAAAEARWPEALRKWDAMVAEWERQANAEEITPERATEIAATWASWIAAGAPLDMGGETSDVFDIGEVDPNGAEELRARMWARVEFHAEEALKLTKITPAGDSRSILVAKMVGPVALAYQSAEAPPLAAAIANGLDTLSIYVGSTKGAVKQALPQVAQPAAPKLTFEDMWESWKKVTNTKPRTVHETLGMLKQLAAFLGHDDASKVTKSDLLRWRTTLKSESLNNNTWNNRLSCIGQAFKRAVADEKIPTDPTNGVRLPKTRNKSWNPYDDRDTVTILLAARGETKPSLRWAHWIMAFTGMRVGEALQLTADDIAQDAVTKVWYFAVLDDEQRGKGTKNAQKRHVPIHPVLIKEGFLTYAQTVQATTPTAPLFPDKKPDKYGRLGGRAWNVVGKWVREKVGITDRGKGPDHSWRHRVEDELRDAGVVESDRDAIVGHARKTSGRTYGVKGESLKRLHRELSKMKLPKGL